MAWKCDAFQVFQAWVKFFRACRVPPKWHSPTEVNWSFGLRIIYGKMMYNSYSSHAALCTVSPILRCHFKLKGDSFTDPGSSGSVKTKAISNTFMMNISTIWSTQTSYSHNHNIFWLTFQVYLAQKSPTDKFGMPLPDFQGSWGPCQQTSRLFIPQKAHLFNDQNCLKQICSLKTEMETPPGFSSCLWGVYSFQADFHHSDFPSIYQRHKPSPKKLLNSLQS